MDTLKHQNILVGITGGIAAYKAVELVRRLQELGAEIKVVMTTAATAFITPLTLQAVSGHAVHQDLLDTQAEAAMGHIELARWADLIIIVPASADFIARLTCGHASDLLSTLCLASTAPLYVAPAMNQQMWLHAATQENIQRLVARGVSILGPEHGSQACGEIGPGRLLQPEKLLAAVCAHFANGMLADKKVIITAGPTREAIDPVRYISNRSSGKMGYALAVAAQRAGAEVIVVSGPVAIPPPKGISVIFVESAAEMQAAVLAASGGCDIFIGAAAVADYHCAKVATQKLTKTAAGMSLHLVPNPDILATVASLPAPPFTVGFAAQTEQVIAKAKQKLKTKQVQMIIANQVGKTLGFDSDNNQVTVLWGEQSQAFPFMAKTQLAQHLIELIATIYLNNQAGEPYVKNPG